ncbi:MAG: Hsp70 family protein [Micrococcales bacterium]|nr:Hsp70 family protein [Micrococcales bacterium]
MGWILAVDFGTTNTGAAIRFADGRVEKVKLDPGSDTMPSAVVLADGHWRVGQAALNARWTHPSTFVASPKTRLGQEPTVLGTVLVDPAQIASCVLAAVRDRAIRAAGGGAPDRLVLTHPVRWGRARLEALREAARLAGFPTDSIRLLPEPIAALHAHVQPGSLPPGSRVVVVDTGGGTCDVAVLQITDDPVPGKDLLVVAQEGDDRLGGNDLDGLVYSWVLAQLHVAGRDDMVAALADPANLDASMALVDMVRSAKQDLSEHTDAPLTVAVVGQKASLTITRDEYEQLISEPVARAATLTSRALTVSGTTQIAGLYLTGGTAYTPALARAMHQATGILTAPIFDPKLAVAIGALNTPTAVMNTVELHQLTEELAARRRQTAQPQAPRPADSLAAAPPPSASFQPQPPPQVVVAPQGTGTGSPDLQNEPPKSSSRGRGVKVLAGVLAGVLVVVGGAVAFWKLRGDDTGPTSAAVPPPPSTVAAASCWDGSNGPCPDFTGTAALEFLFAPPDPDKCELAYSSIDKGKFYGAKCADNRSYKPYDVNLWLWADMDAISAEMVDLKYQATDTWNNADGDTVGTTYTPSAKATDTYTVFCYDQIPACLQVRPGYKEDPNAVKDLMGTLSTAQVRDVVTWLGTNPVSNPTATWDPRQAERAFPAADGAPSLTCSVRSDIKPGDEGADQIFYCEWPGTSGKDTMVTKWSSQEYLAEYYAEFDDVVAEPWIVDGVERGTIYSGTGEADTRWCYSDLTYCIRIMYTEPDEYLARIAPLTAEQAAKL